MNGGKVALEVFAAFIEQKRPDVARKLDTRKVTISTYSGGKQNFEGLEAVYGACLGQRFGESVAFSTSGHGTEVRAFKAPSDLLATVAGKGSIEITKGVHATAGPFSPVGFNWTGPGAASVAAASGMPGMRHGLPDLPAGWARLIAAKAKGA